MFTFEIELLESEDDSVVLKHVSYVLIALVNIHCMTEFIILFNQSNYTTRRNSRFLRISIILDLM
jgi:hypothetical protein